MVIKVSKYAGFCPGVRRADNGVAELIESRRDGECVVTLGELIHNPHYVRSLADSGVCSVTLGELRQLLKADPDRMVTAVIRTHGITREEEDALSELSRVHGGFRYVDLTCPYVKRIQQIAEACDPKKEIFVIFGDGEHPEVRGIVSRVRGEVQLISSSLDATDIDLSGKIPILCAQTTQNLYEFEKIKKIFKKLYTNAKIFDTICSVTENRQIEAIELARESDVMIVVGGRGSSNTQKLYKLCSEVCPKTLLIESAAELTDFPDSAKSTGITAGASTPDGIILEVLKTMENFVEMLEGSLKTLHTGETVTGTVFTIGENEIKLDLGAKFTGVLTKEQITDDPSAKLDEMFKIGDKVEAFVIRVSDVEGFATLSKKRVDADKNWEKVCWKS